VDALLAGMARKGHPLRYEQLVEIVETNNKRRYALSEDRRRIRAVQGHSRAVNLDLQATVPPAQLYHGTVARFLSSIREQGLLRGSRQHVHLSPDRETAMIVGKRRGEPVILTVDATAMVGAGHEFYLSENGVWLTGHVPASFIVRWE
jgi:putative RNA 2'-phosphotransferase